MKSECGCDQFWDNTKAIPVASILSRHCLQQRQNKKEIRSNIKLSNWINIRLLGNCWIEKSRCFCFQDDRITNNWGSSSPSSSTSYSIS